MTQVLKFGGTSVGSVEAIEQVAQIALKKTGKKIVVLSAMSGTTNDLLRLADHILKTETEAASMLLEELMTRYEKVVANLYQEESSKESIKKILSKEFEFLRILTDPLKRGLETEFPGLMERMIVARGEILSANIFTTYLKELGAKVVSLNALDFMCLNDKKEPDMPRIEEKLASIMAKNPSNFYITQGFICRDSKGVITNLERGGSDYTASIIGACVKSENVQIWTDIDGMHNNDPRHVDNTFPIPEISFEEAAELAYFGAKILHPQSVIPAKENNIPVLIKNTFAPDADGTKIGSCEVPQKVRAIAAKDGITAIKIKSFRMLMAYGFLKKIFEIFDKYQTPIDVITTSEVAVSLSIDDDTQLTKITKALEALGTVEVDKEMTIICLAGNFSKGTEGLNAAIFNSLKDIPIRMISYGGSHYNTSIVIDSQYKKQALNALNKGLF